jgi:hypothetical protein
MSRWWLTVALVTASAVASAQPASPTERAIQGAAAAEQTVGGLTRQRGQLGERYQAELVAIDRLKKEKASWRRDRELRASLADSNDTAGQLAALDKQLATARDALAAARRAELAAIDVELGAGATGGRADQLRKLRGQLDARSRDPKKIVIPDAEVDPAADPEELEQQAAQIRAAEQELAKEASSLDGQAKDLAEQADLRKQHDRANDLARRDDDQPHRNTQAPSGTHEAGIKDGVGGGSASTPTPTAGGGSGGGGDFVGIDRGPSATFESEAIVLGDVVDHATIDSLSRASRSGDPAQRADAARRASKAVRAKLEQLQKKRSLIEQRAKQLRK